jgi:hypothetical protein
MLTYHGGTRVRSGFYWSRSSWTVLTLPREGGVLPGGEEHRYLKVPILLLLGLAPVMGGLYVMFLPFIGFAMVLGLAAKRTAGGLARVAAALMATLGPAWRPGEAYFAEKRGEKPEGGEPGGSGRKEAA